jgi:hypothetical protein
MSAKSLRGLPLDTAFGSLRAGWLAWLLALVAGTGVIAADNEPKFAPTSAYETRPLEGWTIRVLSQFPVDEPKLFDETWTLLRYQLIQVVRVVPAEAVEKLRKIPIWVELNEPHHPCMAYHPDSGWLRAHDMNPEKGRAVELANARNFLSWTKQQPWMVLHELAHGYHHQFLEGGHENAELENALTRAKEEKLYDKVLHINGRTDRHYALTNQAEYFAEQTEAYFGTNDFFPFVRPELERHDPRMYDLMRHLWGIDVRPREKAGS